MMKRLILLPVAVFVLAVALSSQAMAQVVTGPASTYIVSVTSIELCSSAACGSPFLLGSGSKSFDIASAAVGGAIGAYASTSGMPIGTTFTHIRTRLSRIIQIAGNAGEPAGLAPGGDCITDGTAGTAGGGVRSWPRQARSQSAILWFRISARLAAFRAPASIPPRESP